MGPPKTHHHFFSYFHHFLCTPYYVLIPQSPTPNCRFLQGKDLGAWLSESFQTDQSLFLRASTKRRIPLNGSRGCACHEPMNPLTIPFVLPLGWCPTLARTLLFQTSTETHTSRYGIWGSCQRGQMTQLVEAPHGGKFDQWGMRGSWAVKSSLFLSLGNYWGGHFLLGVTLEKSHVPSKCPS